MIAASHQMYSALKALVDLKEWKNVHGKDSTYTLNRDIVWARQNMRSSWQISKVMVVEGFAYFLIGMQFMIIATMSAKGYGIFLGMVALISWFTSPLLVLLLFLVPARKGSFWDAD
jgi:hypothetical protein